MERYNTYSDHLKKKYGEKVYKIPISLPVTCPNRDGSLSSEPCIFCGSIGADYETKAVGLPITRQLDRSIAHVGPKYKAKKFIAYFLNYTNTYAPPEDFRSWVEEAMAHPDVVGVDVSTRPDCVNERYLEILKESSEKYGKDVMVELGLQSSNAHTLLKLGRCHTAAEYVDAALRIGRYGFDQCTHVIADLPWDDRVDVIETAKLISVLPVTEVKIHSLYIVKGTELARMYERRGHAFLDGRVHGKGRPFPGISSERHRYPADRRKGVWRQYAYGQRRLSLVGGQEPDRRAFGRKKYHAGLSLRLYRRQSCPALFIIWHHGL